MNIRDTSRVLNAVARDYVPEEINLLPRILSSLEKKNDARLRSRRTSLALIVLVTVLVIVMAAVSIPAVAEAIQHLFGFIPGVGLVDRSAPIRVLAEPVSVTRDGITITVISSTLTGDRTYVAYRIFGVPGSAYPDREGVTGCMLRAYLRLADGTQLAQMDNDYQPVPVGVNEAVFILPCIQETLPGKAPENWELPLRFVPAPPDLTVMPVIELTPSPRGSLTPGATASLETGRGTLIAPVDSSVTVSKVIETSDGYILIGDFQPQSKPGESIQETGAQEIRDASGKKVAYIYPQDVNPAGTGWAVQFKAAGLVYPLTISFSGVTIRPADPSAKAEFTFDVGSNPQPGQEWTLNQDIQLAGHTLKLISVTADSWGGYSFNFKSDLEVSSAGVQINGFTANGGGGGGGGGLTNGTFTSSLSYSQRPTGVLTATLSDLTLIGDSITWQGQWSPVTIRTDLPANPTPQPGVCLTADSLAKLQPAPADLVNGTVLMYESLDNANHWGLVLYNLDGSGKQVLASEASWGSLSPDGDQVAYPASDGIHIINLATKAEKVLAGANGFDLHWSPDGKQIAYVGMGDSIIDSVFVVNTESTQARQVSNLSYESVVGWSPDGTQLYFVVPFTGGVAWKVYSFDLASGSARELFIIENGTPKFLNPTLSLDGKWIAYRGRDNSSLFLVHPDGSDMHLVLDNAGAVGIEWSRSGWLGVSLEKANSDESTVVLIKPDGCQAYLLPPALHGQLEGLRMP